MNHPRLKVFPTFITREKIRYLMPGLEHTQSDAASLGGRFANAVCISAYSKEEYIFTNMRRC